MGPHPERAPRRKPSGKDQTRAKGKQPMTGHIRQRSPGSWEIRFTIDGKTRTATARGTRKDAERELRKRLVAIDGGDAADAGKLTAGQWFERWLGIVRPEIAPATHLHYQR